MNNGILLSNWKTKTFVLSFEWPGIKTLCKRKSHTNTHTHDIRNHCFYKCQLTVCYGPNMLKTKTSLACAFFHSVGLISVSSDAFQSWKQMKANFLAIQHSVTMICYKRECDSVIAAHSCRRTVRTIYRRFSVHIGLLSCMPANNCYFSRVYFVCM